jgi:hypothetical protein
VLDELLDMVRTPRRVLADEAVGGADPSAADQQRFYQVDPPAKACRPGWFRPAHAGASDWGGGGDAQASGRSADRVALWEFRRVRPPARNRPLRRRWLWLAAANS